MDSAKPPIDLRAPLWRPILMVTVGLAYWALRQTPERLQARGWLTYAILAGLWFGCAVATWGIQRLRGSYWPWYAEMFAILGLLFVATFLLDRVPPMIRG